MNSKRAYFAMLGGILLLLILFAGGAYLSTKLLAKEGASLLELKLLNSVLDKQQQDLNQAKKDITDFSELEQITKSIVPQSKDQASTMAEIAKLANESGISLGAIEFPESQLGQVSKGKDKKAKAVDESKTQLTELEDLKGVYSMEISVRNHTNRPVEYSKIIRYLELLENNRRTAQVTTIDITPDTEVPSLFHFVILLNTYIKPE